MQGRLNVFIGHFFLFGLKKKDDEFPCITWLLKNFFIII